MLVCVCVSVSVHMCLKKYSLPLAHEGVIQQCWCVWSSCVCKHGLHLIALATKNVFFLLLTPQDYFIVSWKCCPSMSSLPLLSNIPTVCFQKWKLGQCKVCPQRGQEGLGKYDLLNRTVPHKKLHTKSLNHCLSQNNHYSSENNKPTMCLPLLRSLKIGCLTDVRSACYYRATLLFPGLPKELISS